MSNDSYSFGSSLGKNIKGNISKGDFNYTDKYGDVWLPIVTKGPGTVIIEIFKKRARNPRVVLTGSESKVDLRVRLDSYQSFSKEYEIPASSKHLFNYGVQMSANDNDPAVGLAAGIYLGWASLRLRG